MDSNQEFNEESNLLDYFIVIIIFGLTGYILYKIFKQKNKSKRHPKNNNINPRQNLPYSHNNNYGNNNELNYHNYNIGNFYKKKIITNIANITIITIIIQIIISKMKIIKILIIIIIFPIQIIVNIIWNIMIIQKEARITIKLIIN